MAYDDILGEEEPKDHTTTQSIIEALKQANKEKDEMISDLIKQVTELERQIEYERSI